MEMPQIFENKEFGAVRTFRDKAGEPLFVAKDVALALGYEWNGNARIAHIPAEWMGVTSVVTPSGTQEMVVLIEQGLYFFLGRSDKPKPCRSKSGWLEKFFPPSVSTAATSRPPR